MSFDFFFCYYYFFLYYFKINMKKFFKKKKEKYTPELPRWVEVAYVGSFLITLLFSEGFIHGFFSVAPIFLILRITFARLVRGDLGSTVVCLS